MARAVPTTLSIYSQVKKMQLIVVSCKFCYQIYKLGASHNWGFSCASNNTISDRNLNCTSIVDPLLGQTEITNYLDRRVLKSPILWTLLGAFAKLQKGTISFVMSVCLSVRTYMCVCPSAWNNSTPNERIIIKFAVWLLFENLSWKLKFH